MFIFLLQTTFCELVLPFIIHDILESGTELHERILSKHMRQSFLKHSSSSASTRTKPGRLLITPVNFQSNITFVNFLLYDHDSLSFHASDVAVRAVSGILIVNFFCSKHRLEGFKSDVL
jgi:hypothetical protein